MGLLSTYPTIAGQHAPTHQPGGEDVIIGIAPGAHAVTHILAGADPIIAGLDARALNLAAQGEIVYRAAAANTLVALAVGVAGQSLLSGGPAANITWGAPAPAAHEATHVAGGADDIDAALDARALGLTAQGEIVFHAAAATTLATLAVGAAGQALLSGGAGADISWGAPAPAAHASTHQSAGSDEVRNIELNPGLADETGSGLLALVTVGENVVTGDTLFLQNDGKYWKSDADQIGTMPAKVIVIDATIAADATGTVMHEGYYRNDDRYNWTPGAGAANLLFAHTTPGELVQLANQPAGAGDQVQVCGWIVDANNIYWRPSLELVEIS